MASLTPVDSYRHELVEVLRPGERALALDAVASSAGLDDIAEDAAVGTLATRFSDALEKGGASICMLVTDRRVVLVRQETGKAFSELLAVPRAAVRSARAQPRLLTPGRLSLDFADGSQHTLLTGLMLAGAAKRLAAAIGGR